MNLSALVLVVQASRLHFPGWRRDACTTIDQVISDRLLGVSWPILGPRRGHPSSPPLPLIAAQTVDAGRPSRGSDSNGARNNELGSRPRFFGCPASRNASPRA